MAFTIKTDLELKNELTPLQYEVTQNSATEPPFRNAYYNCFVVVIYVDITTGEPLFSSSDKFESGCGWPAFAKPIDPNTLMEHTDQSHGMIRTEVRSNRSNAHLGHVFDDAPQSLGGLRYCINSAALRFIPKDQMTELGYGEWLPYVSEPTAPLGKIKIIQGNITTLAVDAIVNAANSSLLGGSGVDGACYRSALTLAVQNKIKSIAFPCISTGIYHYPFEEAAKITLETILEFLRHDQTILEVLLVCFSDDDFSSYKQVFEAFSSRFIQ